jgi:hypothetical protein
MSNWFSKGFGEAESQVAEYSSGGWTREFFLKSGETTKVNILDEESFNIRDHFVKGKGWFTCIQGLQDEDCPLCEDGNKATNHFVFNVLDPREYVDKKGNSHKNQVKIWRVGITLLRVLEKRRNSYGAYPTLDLEVEKMGQGQSTVYDIQATKREKPVKLPEGEDLYDLTEVLAPKTRKEIINALTKSDNSPTDIDDEDDGDERASWRK